MTDPLQEFTASSERVGPQKPENFAEDLRYENPSREEADQSVMGRQRGSIFAHLQATIADATVPDISDEEFIAALKKAHRRPLSQKEDNRLISPSVFDPALSLTNSRGLKNVISANGIWLDIDIGDMRHGDLALLVPHVRMVCFNSFESTKAQPRYRVFVPTTRSMSAEEYGSVVGQIIQTVRNAGFRDKPNPARPDNTVHDIDLSKRHAAALFYLPSQPKDPKGKIWKDHAADGRKPLDVDSWLAHAIPVEVADNVVDEVHSRSEGTRQVDRERVDRAMHRWNTVGMHAGNGDRELFRLALEIRHSRLPFIEAEALLIDAAKRATSPVERLRQANAILRKKRHSWPI